MKRAFLFKWQNSPRSGRELRAFGEGLKRHGWHVDYGIRDTDATGGYDLLVQWGVRNSTMVDAQLARGDEVCILETSYIEPRADYTSVGFGNGVNRRLRHYGPFDDATRWRERFWDKLQPWQPEKEGPVYIMGQLPGDMSVKPFVNFYEWVFKTYTALKDAGVEDVRYRPHPAAKLCERQANMQRKALRTCVNPEELALWSGYFKMQDAGVPIETSGTLRDCLKCAKYVVTYNSNSGVDAALAGVPAITSHDGAMAWDVTSQHLLTPIRPSRIAWSEWLSWCQWDMAELADGVCWEHARPPHLG